MTSSNLPAIRRPEAWWTVTETWVSGTSLYYVTGPAAPLREEGDWRRDDRGRCALEAFSALPLDLMYERLRAYYDELRGKPDAKPDQTRLRAALRELVDLVTVFGPLGLEADRSYPVEVSEAESWRRELQELRWEHEGRKVEPQAKAAYLHATTARWRVTFPAPGEAGLPRVTTYHAYPELSWENRVRSGDEALAHDDLGPANVGPLFWAVDTLQRTVELARALSAGNGAAVRRSMEERPLPAVINLWRPEQTGDPLALEWRRAVRPGARTPETPFERPEAIDWTLLGRIVLGAMFQRQLWWLSPRVELTEAGELMLGSQVGSLLEVMYLQLLEHVQERLDLGIGVCGYCGGPILNVRRRQAWHPKLCASAGRKRRSRDATAQAPESEPSR